jgi:6-phospho-beta-glucosidase
MPGDRRAPYRLVIVGGSATATPELAEAIEAWPGGEDRRPPLTVVLHGRSGDKLELVARAFRKRLGASAATVAVETSDELTAAVEGADVILNQVRIGGLTAREFDETFPHRFGLPGEETIGPGGAANAIRTVPALARTWETIAKRAPTALVLNLTNPSGIVVAAGVRAFGLRLVSICDSPITLTESISTRLGRDPDAVRRGYLGCNHVGWWIGTDPSDLELLADLATGLGPEEVAITGAVPGPYIRYYLTPERILAAQRGGTPRARELRALQEAQLAAYTAGAQTAPSRRAVWYSKGVVPFLDAWWNGSPGSQILGLPNDGDVAGVPSGVVVERAVVVTASGTFDRLPPPALPTFPNAIVSAHAAYESLLIDALVAGPTRRTLIRALAANPMVRGLDQAAALVDAILQESPRG